MEGNLLIKTNCIIVISVWCRVLWNPKKDAPIKYCNCSSFVQSLAIIQQFLLDHELERNLSHFECYIIFELNEENYRKNLGRRHISLKWKISFGRTFITGPFCQLGNGAAGSTSWAWVYTLSILLCARLHWTRHIKIRLRVVPFKITLIYY